MNIFMKRILSISPWVAALLVIRAIKIKKINRELKTLEQLEEKTIDENNYSIQEEGWLGILFLVGTIFFSGLLLYRLTCESQTAFFFDYFIIFEN